VKSQKALKVFIIMLIFTSLSCFVDAIINRETLLSAFAVLGLFGSIVSFIATLFEAFSTPIKDDKEKNK
jgi:hypothetical protein